MGYLLFYSLTVICRWGGMYNCHLITGGERIERSPLIYEKYIDIYLYMRYIFSYR